MTTSKTAAKNGAGAREVVSLDSLSRQRRDGLGEPTTFELLGVEFALPHMKALPFELQEKVSNPNDIAALMKFVLGEEKVREMYAAGFQMGDMELIGEEWQRRSGLEPGESVASPTS